MAAFVYDDVPQEICDVLNIIDFSRIPPHVLTQKLQLLEHHAQEYLPRRQDFSKRGTISHHKLRAGVPQEALDTINKFDFRDVSILKRALYKPAFMKWVRANLPTR